MTRRATVYQSEILVVGVFAKAGEGLLHVEAVAVPLGHHAFGLLDHDTADESTVELFGDQLSLGDRPVLENGDGGYVGQSLGGEDVGLAHLPGGGPERIQGADGLASQSHGQSVHRPKPRLHGHRSEAGPGTIRRRQILVQEG
ncbi:MAG: hypothetical protein ACRDV9_07365 [Acidimicrobiia bacterium]